MYNPQLETFLKVADAGSFNKAAELSYITPTAVIKQINLLEANLGVKLFERTHRGLVLTKAGTSLYKDAKYVIQYCRDSVIRAKNAMQEDENVIRIGTSPMTPAQILVELWPKIHEICPEIKFQLVPFENTPENAREILKNLGQNIDVVAVQAWDNVHPLLKVIPMEWEHSIPYGLLHSQTPSETVARFLGAVQTVLHG
jgi:DNA-binding transcriptional LysR family regulator